LGAGVEMDNFISEIKSFEDFVDSSSYKYEDVCLVLKLVVLIAALLITHQNQYQLILVKLYLLLML
jgi:hypothetical protein